MATPVSAFWSCYGYIDRLRADETMNALPQHSYAQMDEAGRKELISALQDQMGTVVVEKPVFDREGWRELKKISQK